MSRSNAGVHFITFSDGSEDYRAAGMRLASQASETGWFASVHSLHEEHLAGLSPLWFESHRPFIRGNSRGLGYWLWKPFIILESLKRLPEDDILVYADAGFEISKGGGEKFRGYVEEARRSAFFSFEVPRQIHEWTKGDLLEYFSVRRESDLCRENLIQANLLFFKKTRETLLFTSHWAELSAARNYSLLDDTISVAPNPDGFVEHRHDQSILTLLARMYRFGSTFPIEDHHPDVWAAGHYIVENPFHSFRNRTGRRFIND